MFEEKRLEAIQCSLRNEGGRKQRSPHREKKKDLPLLLGTQVTRLEKGQGSFLFFLNVQGPAYLNKLKT